MKHIILFIVLFVSFLYAAVDSTAVINASVNNANINQLSPPALDVIMHTLFDNTEDTGDTIAKDDALIIGPFPLSYGGTTPNHKYMSLVGTNLAAGDSLDVTYQIASSSSILDTNSNWVTCDTIRPLLGPIGTALDLTQKTGHYIWLRFENFTETAVIVPGYQRLYFRKNQDYTKK